MNKLKFLVLAHVYLIRMLWNHGVAATSEFFAGETSHREKVKAYCEAFQIPANKTRSYVARKYAILRLKEASVKKS